MATTRQSSTKTAAKPSVPRNRRNPEKTRKAILEVAGKMMAMDGPEGLSVSQIAQEAGVNRGTAYHHFQTREQLVEATMEYVSQRLHDEVFAKQDLDNPQRPRDVIEKLSVFAMENPEFGPAWMHQMMRDRSATEKDPFWQGMISSVTEFANSDYAQPGVDAEVHALTVLTSIFMWPLWSNAREKSSRQRKALAKRYTQEALRLAANGLVRPGAFPVIDELRAQAQASEQKVKVKSASKVQPPAKAKVTAKAKSSAKTGSKAKAAPKTATKARAKKTT